ncbi:MAG: bifunctional 3-(3-hydroxy-phenyl)propionate/3-hydroxycinnamic acid hydroxylase [Hyphomicrobiaceae bacterium]
MRDHWPVIVVGAGPTGLTVANLLTRYGIDVLLVERNAQTVQEPRAVSIDDESLRTMQSVGIVHDLLPDIVLGYGSEYYSPARRRFLKVKPAASEYGYPRRNAFRQPVLEATLKAHLSGSPRATILFETEVTGFEQSGEQVSVCLKSQASERKVSCDYMIGCDGSRSFVRHALGITLEGSTFKERWLIIDLDNSSDTSRDTKVFCDPARPCLSLPGPRGTRRFEFMLHDGEAEAWALSQDNVAALLSAHGEQSAADIHRKVVYTFHARLAERWSDGRVFIAGDAAHLTPPFAGQGMNSGIRDAHNLAWKVAAVVKRQLGSGLLDTYEMERRDHARQMIDLAVRMGHIMMPRTRTGAFALQNFFRILALYPPARSYFAEMKYKPKPRFSKGFLIEPPRDQDGAGLVGTLFPQALVAGRDGYKLLDDVLGDGFALVAPPGTPADLLPGADAASADGLAIRRVAVLDREDASIPADGIVGVRDVRGELAGRLLGHSAGLYLIRPDRYVAAFFAVSDVASLSRRIGRLCDSTRAEAQLDCDAAGLTLRPQVPWRFTQVT